MGVDSGQPAPEEIVLFSSGERRHGRVSGLHEDAAVSVELQDLPQSLLGCGHAFFGPLAWRRRSRVNSHD